MTLTEIKAMLAQLVAAIAEYEASGPVGPIPPADLAPFGHDLAGNPNPPPALSGAVRIIDTATSEGWPGPRDNGRPWTKWDYLRGVRQLGVGAAPQPEPISATVMPPA